MKNLNVKLKLIISFAIITILLAVVGTIASISMSFINQSGIDMYHYNVSGINVLGSIRENYALQRAIYRNFIIYDADSDYFQKAIQSLSDLETQMESHIEAYITTITEQEDEESFHRFIADYRGEFKNLKEQLITLGRQNQKEQAMNVLASDAILKLSDSIDKSLNNCYEYNATYAKEAIDSSTSQAGKATSIVIGIFVASCLLALFLSIYISRLIAKPLTIMTEYFKNVVSTGEMSLTKENEALIEKYSKTKDETGVCVSSMAAFVKRMLEIGESLETIARGDLNIELALLSDQDTMGLSLHKMLHNLNGMFGKVNEATIQVSVGSKQIADGAQTLAQGSTEQAAAVEQLSSSISDITQKTKDNAEMADKAAKLADTIKENANMGSLQMNEMIRSVKEINQASRDISKVIKVIDDIAFQTNILSLNAAVEAARAGEAGKGFAVVAEEVRNLAAKSAESAKDTENLINNSMEKAEQGERIAEETAVSLNEILTGINESNHLVGNIARSSEEQASAITEIKKGIEQVAQVTQENSAAAEESAATSEELSEQSLELKKMVAQFKLMDAGERD